MNRVAHLLLVVCVFSSGVFAQAVVFDYSKLYEASSPAVVQVTTEDGSGSGFLVTPFGHIATNFHVVRGSRYLAIQFPNGRKVKAAIVAVNPHYDMAVLKVNSEVVAGIEPLSLLSEEKDASVKVGIPVVAIGSPLNQKFLMTQGIRSKVDASQFGPQRIDIQVGFQVDQTASCRFYVRSGGADYKDAIACS